MHLFILAEGFEEAHQEMLKRWDRKYYPGLGVKGGPAMVKMGEVRLYTMRFAKGAKAAVMEDLKRHRFMTLDEFTSKRFQSTGVAYKGPGIKINRFFSLLRWGLDRTLGWFGLRTVSLKEPNKQAKFLPVNECLWKIVIAEGDDREENEEEVL